MIGTPNIQTQIVSLDQVELLPLREELQVLLRAEGPMIFDQVQNKHIRISERAVQFLTHWRLGRGDKLAETLRQLHGVDLSLEELQDFIQFLNQHNLIEGHVEENKPQAVSFLKWVQKRMSQLLMIKFPLWQPDRFLRASFPYISIFFSTAFAWCLLPLGLLALFLISQRWGEFTSTFMNFFTLQGVVFYGLALAGIKVLHELGHAYFATKFGVRVPTIGVALVLFFPVMYTDTTDAWRLDERRKRLLIDFGGIFVELSLAVFASFAWLFLPEGTPKSLAFVVASTSWILSLLINLNPFMRFDGYYILSDGLGLENMQSRANAFARWRLRELIFGLGEAMPESLTSTKRRFLTLLAVGTWLYRLMLFTAISAMVYTFFVKIIGVILFVGVIINSLVAPLASELSQWWQRKDRIIRTPRTYFSAICLSTLLGVFFVPWNNWVGLPAIASAQEEARLHPPISGQLFLIAVNPEQYVEKGEVLFVLKAPDRDIERRRDLEELNLLTVRHNRMVADREDRENRTVILEQIAAVREKLEGFDKRTGEFTIRAPISGILRDFDTELQTGQWVNSKQRLAVIVGGDGLAIQAVANENKLARINSSIEHSTFIPDDPILPKIPLQLHKISQLGMEEIQEPYLASKFGGAVAVREDEDGRLVPDQASFEVRFTAHNTLGRYEHNGRVMRGKVLAQTQSQSMAEAFMRHISQIFIREAGV